MPQVLDIKAPKPTARETCTVELLFCQEQASKIFPEYKTMASQCPEAKCLFSAGLGAQVLFPNDLKYTDRIESYFDNSAKLPAACIFQPQTAIEAAKAIKALAGAEQTFAIRSGGWTVKADSSNIDGGVTVDLALLNSVEYDSSTKTAQIGPGATWYVRNSTLNLSLRAAAS